MRRRRQRGQSLIELALLAPFLIVLLAGSAQVGVIAYGSVTADTAAREGARIASVRPANATRNFGASNSLTFDGCLDADVNNSSPTVNYAVQAVCNNVGILDKSKVVVKITRNVDVTAVRQPSVRLVSACAVGAATLSGAVNGIPPGQSATVQTTADPAVRVQVPASNPSYSVCLPTGRQTVSAIVGSGCTALADSIVLDPTVTPTHDFTLAATQPCVSAIATTISLTPVSTTVVAGQQVVLSSTVTPASGGTPSGSVTFSDTTNGATVVLATVPLSGGSAGYQTTALTVGNHSISADYVPDAIHAPSSSSPAGVTVTLASGTTATTTSISATPSPVTQGSNVRITAVVSGATPTGTVTFYDTTSGTTTALTTVTLSAGNATYTTSGLTAGSHSLTVIYSGDATNGSSSSPGTVVTVTASSGGTPGPGPFRCTDPPAGLSTMYLKVEVTYPVPIFVPFVGGLFASGSGSRNVTISQVIRIEPCGITQGQ